MDIFSAINIVFFFFSYFPHRCPCDSFVKYLIIIILCWRIAICVHMTYDQFIGWFMCFQTMCWTMRSIVVLLPLSLLHIHFDVFFLGNGLCDDAHKISVPRSTWSIIIPCSNHTLSWACSLLITNVNICF